MNISQSAQLLKTQYDQAPHRDKAAHVVLFGIKHSSALANHSIAEVTAMSGIGKWGPQVALAKKPAAFVELKE